MYRSDLKGEGVKVKMKRFGLMLLSIFILFGLLAACSSGEDSSDGSDGGDAGGSGGETVTLTVWGDGDNQSELETAFTRINEAFEEKYPNIKLNYEYSGTLESINVALQSDSLPDLFWVQGNKSTQMAEMARNGYLLSLEDYDLDYSRFPEESLEYATVDGEVYSSLPSFIAYVTIYYNKDIFDEYGLEVPTNWDKFEEICKVLADNGVTPVAVGGNGDFDRYWMMQAMGASLANDVLTGIVEGEEDIDFTNLEKTFQAYRDFSLNGYFGEDVTAIDGNGAKLAFTNGEAAMIADGTWNINTYLDTNLNVDSFALPGFDGKRYAQSGPSNFNTYAISSKTEHPDEAVKYLEFLNSQEAQQILSDETGLVPMLDDIEPRDEIVEQMAAFDEIGLNIYNILSQVATETSKPQDLLLTDLAPRLMTGQIDGKEAVDLLIEELEK